MIVIAYRVVRIEDRWMVIGHGLGIGPFSTRARAEDLARRMADQSSVLERSPASPGRCRRTAPRAMARMRAALAAHAPGRR
jgi:hypothetical protein